MQHRSSSRVFVFVSAVHCQVPDLTGFKLQGDAVQVNDQMCDSWQLEVTTLNKTSTYNFYVSRTTGQAVRYQMMGYDSLIGSHFDLYQLDYENLTNIASFPEGIFDQPALQCGAFPGPGATHMVSICASIRACFHTMLCVLLLILALSVASLFRVGPSG